MSYAPKRSCNVSVNIARDGSLFRSPSEFAAASCARRLSLRVRAICGGV